MSSVTNLALNVVVAGTGTRDEFGALGLVSALYLLQIGVIRGAVADPYTVLKRPDQERERPAALGSAVMIGLALGALAVGAGLLIDGPLRGFLLVYGLVTPGLLVQDTARLMLYSHRQPLLNLESNLLWAVTQIVLSPIALAAGSPIGLLLAWAVGGWVSGAYCLWRLGSVPSTRGWRAWFKGRVALTTSWVADQFAQQGVAQLLVWTIGLAAGLKAVGAYRGAVVLTGPATVMIGGLVRGTVFPAAVRRAHDANGSLERFVIGQVVPIFTLLGVVLLVPLVFLPDGIGEFLLAETWDASKELLPIVVAGRLLTVMTVSFSLGLRATADHRLSLYLRLAAGAATLVGATTAAARWGALGGAAALTIISAALLPAWFLAFTRAARAAQVTRAAQAAHRAPSDQPQAEPVSSPVDPARMDPAVEASRP